MTQMESRTETTRMAVRSRTGLDYAQRIDRTIVYIRDHLDDPLDLETLAGVACFSVYHFHRIYRSLTGETTWDTIRRIRLHRAAGHLVKGDLAVTKIATQAGYGSVAAFTRAFGKAYGVSPAAYREQGRVVSLSPPNKGQEFDMYDVTIREIPPLRLAAINHTGAYMNIGSCFDRLIVWAGPRQLTGPDTRMIGVYYDDPGSVAEEALRSQAAMTIPDDFTPDGEVELVELPGGRAAVIRHTGPYAELERAYSWLYGDWLPTSGETPADTPPYEDYLNDPREVQPSELVTEIIIPLEAK